MPNNSATTNEQVFKLVCQKIKSETHDVKSFIFSHSNPDRTNKFQSWPGQHISFTLNIAGVKHHCNYTLSSSPLDTSGIRITVKRVPNGVVSNFLHDHFKVGQEIETKGPTGDFYLPSPAPDNVLLISAGSGITPMLSMLRFMVKTETKNHIIFFHSAQNEVDLIAKKEVESLAASHGNCEVVFTLTQKASSRWLGFQGRVNHGMLKGIQQLSSYQVFVCGPKGFRKVVQEILRSLGLPRGNYHYESFGLHEYIRDKTYDVPPKQHNAVESATNKTTPPAIQQSESTKVSIHFKRWNKFYQGNTQDTLLEQGEAAGLILPYSCRAGCCGSCKAKLIHGQVEQLSQDGLSVKERQQGYILLCSAKALTDIEVSHE